MVQELIHLAHNRGQYGPLGGRGDVTFPTKIWNLYTREIEDVTSIGQQQQLLSQIKF